MREVRCNCLGYGVTACSVRCVGKSEQIDMSVYRCIRDILPAFVAYLLQGYHELSPQEGGVQRENAAAESKLENGVDPDRLEVEHR
jgi:hypothetical protein